MLRAKLLIVEDEPALASNLKEVLEDAGYTARTALTGAEALEAIAEEPFDLVVQDIRLPDSNGLDILRETLARRPETAAVVMTAHGSIEDAVEAMKIGAFDFLTKPFPIERLLEKVDRALSGRPVVVGSADADDPFGSIITASPWFRGVITKAAGIAVSDVSVLIQGESGTGKEMVARAIHRGSGRRNGPFIAVNCASIPEALIEAELFGVERGAFTGADRSRQGFFEAASGGTLFLDEISEMPLHLQVKLLRALQERVIIRVGGTQQRSVDFRLITAANRQLDELVRQGAFREDLYYRIKVVDLELPPLRERRVDIPLLLAHYLKKFASEQGVHPPVIAAEAMEAIVEYSFPGNVRELRNLAEQFVVLYGGGKVHRRNLPPDILRSGVSGVQFEHFDVGKPLRDAVADYEKRYIEKVLKSTGGQKGLAARVLGLSRKVLWEKLKKK